MTIRIDLKNMETKSVKVLYIRTGLRTTRLKPGESGTVYVHPAEPEVTLFRERRAKEQRERGRRITDKP